LSKPEMKPGFPGCQAHSTVTTTTTLSQLFKDTKTMLPPLLCMICGLFLKTTNYKCFKTEC
jgi:hypothetical protein